MKSYHLDYLQYINLIDWLFAGFTFTESYDYLALKQLQREKKRKKKVEVINNN